MRSRRQVFEVTIMDVIHSMCDSIDFHMGGTHPPF